jgi:hypothetical protein
MIDELAKRKENFDELNSVRVRLADGQEWAVPKPWLEIRPVFRDGRSVGNYATFSYGPELEGLVEAMADCESRSAQLVAVASLAAYLLGQQYDLVDGELDQLLAFRPDDPTSAEWVERVMEIATGNSGPKAGRAGGA